VEGEELRQGAVAHLHLGREAHHVAERLPRIVLAQGLPRALGEPLEAVPHEGGDEVVLARKVAVDGADADPGRAGDLLDRAVEPVLREPLAGGGQDRVAVATGVGAHGSGFRGGRGHDLENGIWIPYSIPSRGTGIPVPRSKYCTPDRRKRHRKPAP
jgi:hypothetical protein